MKNIYKFSLTILAVVIAMAGVWAMQGKKHSDQKFDTSYYHYLGNDDNLASYQLQSNWEILSDKDEPGCSTGIIPCVVESEQSNVQDFVSSIQNETDVEGHEYSKKNPITEE